MQGEILRKLIEILTKTVTKFYEFKRIRDAIDFYFDFLIFLSIK